MAGHINPTHHDDLQSIDSAVSNYSYASTPNHSHCDGMQHHDLQHELSTATRASSSSCSADRGSTGLPHIGVEEGQGESCCDNSVGGSSKSRTHVVAEYGEYPGLTDPRRRRSQPADTDAATDTATANHRSSCFCKDIEQEQEYFQQILGSSSYGWTDEKHSSYLDSMEADFLRSVMFRGNVNEDLSSEFSDSASSHRAKSSNEFKVCQNGRWRPRNVHASYVGPLAQVAVAVKNPWIKRFRSPKVSPLFLQDPLLLQAAMDSRRRRRRRIEHVLSVGIDD